MFLCIQKHLWKEARLEDVHVPHVPKVLSCLQYWAQRTLTKGKCCRERCEGWQQERTGAWAGSPAGVWSREKCTSLNWGLQLAEEPAAQPSQHLHSPLRMSLVSQGQISPFTASPSFPFKPTQTFARQTPEVCYLFPTKTAHSQSCISSIRVWGVSCFGSAAPSADNACHLIHRQWHVKCPFGESPIIVSLAFREQ